MDAGDHHPQRRILTQAVDVVLDAPALGQEDQCRPQQLGQRVRDQILTSSAKGGGRQSSRAHFWLKLSAAHVTSRNHLRSDRDLQLFHQRHAQLRQLATMLRLNLFTYRELADRLDDPFNTPPLAPLAEQLELDLQ